MMIVDPCIVDQAFMGYARNVCRPDQIIANHFHYDRCIRMWIHNIHPKEENHLIGTPPQPAALQRAL